MACKHKTYQVCAYHTEDHTHVILLETPRIKTPGLEIPRLEIPKFETPRFETPGLETLRFETPRLETPRFLLFSLVQPAMLSTHHFISLLSLLGSDNWRYNDNPINLITMGYHTIQASMIGSIMLVCMWYVLPPMRNNYLRYFCPNMRCESWGTCFWVLTKWDEDTSAPRSDPNLVLYKYVYEKNPYKSSQRPPLYKILGQRQVLKTGCKLGHWWSYKTLRWYAGLFRSRDRSIFCVDETV